MVMSERPPQQKNADQHDQNAAGGLELRCPAAIGEGAADHREAREHQHDGEADVGYRQNHAIDEALDRTSRLAEVIDTSTVLP